MRIFQMEKENGNSGQIENGNGRFGLMEKMRIFEMEKENGERL